MDNRVLGRWWRERRGVESCAGELSDRFEGRFGTEQGECLLGLDEAQEVDAGRLERLTVAGENGLVVDRDYIGTIVDETPEGFSQSQFLLHTEMDEVVRRH